MGERLVSCPGATRDTADPQIEDMLAGIPRTTDATNKLRTEGTFSSAGDKCFFWPAPSVVLPFLPARAHDFTQ